MPDKDGSQATGGLAGNNRGSKVRRVSAKTTDERNDQAEPESVKPTRIVETDGTAAGAKRTNRRKRGKGKQHGKDLSGEPQNIPLANEGDGGTAAADAPGKSSGQRPSQPPQRKLDPEMVAKNAWKIYLSEVSEEGIALINDKDARDIARRCFRLAEIFLEEQSGRN